LGADRFLSDQVAVVTGASRGIGRAIAQGLVECGANLCVVGRHKETLTMEAPSPRTAIRAYEADITIDIEVDNLADNIQRDFGKVDILVISSGLHYMGEIETTPVGQLDLLYRANVRAPYRLTQALLPSLKENRGQIIFINSSLGLNSKAHVGHFASTQHALRALADSLRDEINAFGVRVVSVFPGRTATPRMKSIFEQEGKKYQPELLLQPADVADLVIHALKLPRTAEVTDIAVRPLMKSY
jgi:NADP-dependent 3-hydroxy acid dehydrogenase YdfG